MLSPVTYYLSGSIYGVKCCFILFAYKRNPSLRIRSRKPNFFGRASSPPENRQETTHHGYSCQRASHTDNITHSCKIYQRCQVKNLSLFQGEIASNKSVSLQTSKLSFIPLCSLPIWIACTESVPRPSPLLLAAIACRAHLSPELGSIAIQVQIHFWRTAESK